MTAAQKLIDEGMQQEKLEIARSMLRKGFDIKLIQEVTNLIKATIEELKK